MESTSAPRYAGACDCHIHVYEDGYPLAPGATFRPAPAPVSAYREVQRALGLTHVVVVQPTGYGFDNRCMLSALEQFGSAARGVAMVPPDSADDQLARLHNAGVRGMRYMMLAGGLSTWSGLEADAARIAPLGWNIDLQLDGRDLPRHESTLMRLPGKLVIDHTGKFLEPVQPDSEAFQSLCRVLDRGHCWVKLSAPYETSRAGAPGYDDVALLARTLAARYPERCLWGTNWPHPNAQPRPVDAVLLDWLTRCAGSESTTRKILVDNPRELYGFRSEVGADEDACGINAR
ncbi:amidohydrolase family protein [Paraburkholderia saeva]|uniref:2-pyrone-4,6-dicarbaxylate hydrolase n=1 Tax=Paraburkholderia saeva TaxID=2777537 RepID=A0A9N8X3T2_9BURK|nr:amidohydrolase family protein [Paraburkholderia saeva]CAG4916944.1 2-pyrone-4,6-dicarbaxylate hydrolase [Paraburkholderia saeva]